jgi:hypothetical protein
MKSAVARTRNTYISREVIKYPGMGGPKRYQPTTVDKQRVKQLVLLGLPLEVIATCVGKEGISAESLRIHFKDIIDRHKNIELGKIAMGAYRMALPIEDGGDKRVPMELRARMMQFILKTRGGWKENDNTIINAHNVQIVKRIIGVDESEI